MTAETPFVEADVYSDPEHPKQAQWRMLDDQHLGCFQLPGIRLLQHVAVRYQAATWDDGCDQQCLFTTYCPDHHPTSTMHHPFTVSSVLALSSHTPTSIFSLTASIYFHFSSLWIQPRPNVFPFGWKPTLSVPPPLGNCPVAHMFNPALRLHKASFVLAIIVLSTDKQGATKILAH